MYEDLFIKMDKLYRSDPELFENTVTEEELREYLRFRDDAFIDYASPILENLNKKLTQILNIDEDEKIPFNSVVEKEIMDFRIS